MAELQKGTFFHKVEVEDPCGIGTTGLRARGASAASEPAFRSAQGPG